MHSRGSNVSGLTNPGDDDAFLSIYNQKLREEELVLLDDYQAEISIDPSVLTRKDKHAQKTLRK